MDSAPGRSFETLREIVDHVRGRFPAQVFVGRDYSKADLIRDLERIDVPEVPH